MLTSTQLNLLSSSETDADLYGCIAMNLSKASKNDQPLIVSDLCRLFLSSKDWELRKSIIATLGVLVEDEETVKKLAPSIIGNGVDDEETDKNIVFIRIDNFLGPQDEMYRALWAMSRRAGVRILWDGKEGVKVVKM